MNKYVLVMIGLAVVVLVVVGGAIAWYLVSPLFIDRTVDESFPLEAPGQEGTTQVPEEEHQTVESQVPERAESTPDKILDEEM